MIEAEPELILSRNDLNRKNGPISTSSSTDDEAYFVLGKSYEFQCSITGNPEPDHVTWVICDESGNSCINEKKYKRSVSKKIQVYIEN